LGIFVSSTAVEISNSLDGDYEIQSLVSLGFKTKIVAVGIIVVYCLLLLTLLLI